MLVHTNVPTLHLWKQFAVDSKSRIERKPDYKHRAAWYPVRIDIAIRCNTTSSETRSFDTCALHRRHEVVGDRQPAALRTDENTISEDEEGPSPDDPAHRARNFEH